MLGELEVRSTDTLLKLHGEVDMLTIEELRQLLDQARNSAHTHLVIDLSDVPFIDVLSLSAVLATADSMRERHAGLSVVGASASVRRVCALLNADDVLAPALPQPRSAAG